MGGLLGLGCVFFPVAGGEVGTGEDFFCAFDPPVGGLVVGDLGQVLVLVDRDAEVAAASNELLVMGASHGSEVA